MKQYKLFLRNYLCIFFLLPFLGGCEKNLIGGEKILGTATINGQNYKESIIWAWNFQGYPSYLEFNKNYKVFDFIARLSPEKGGNPSYSIIIYVSADDFQFKTNHPYIINSYKDENIDTLYWLDIIPYFARNASEILKENAEGIAYAASSVSEKRIPLKGELVLENINPQTNVCHGHYFFLRLKMLLKNLLLKGNLRQRLR